MVIGHPTSEDRRFKKILKVARVSSFNDVHDLAARFNVKCGVIDIEPETHKVREFQASEPYKIFLCDYAENQKAAQKVDEERGLIVVKRTEFLDKSHTLVADLRVTIPRRCPEIEEFAEQVCNTAKVLKEDEETGSRKYTYIKLGPDHYRHALSYFSLACEEPMVGIMSIGLTRATPREEYNAYETNLLSDRDLVNEAYSQSYY
jgi:hypothetical protein